MMGRDEVSRAWKLLPLDGLETVKLCPCREGAKVLFKKDVSKFPALYT